MTELDELEQKADAVAHVLASLVRNRDRHQAIVDAHQVQIDATLREQVAIEVRLMELRGG